MNAVGSLALWPQNKHLFVYSILPNVSVHHHCRDSVTLRIGNIDDDIKGDFAFVFQSDHQFNVGHTALCCGKQTALGNFDVGDLRTRSDRPDLKNDGRKGPCQCRAERGLAEGENCTRVLTIDVVTGVFALLHLGARGPVANFDQFDGNVIGKGDGLPHLGFDHVVRSHRHRS